jgi:hypothetical protein
MASPLLNGTSQPNRDETETLAEIRDECRQLQEEITHLRFLRGLAVENGFEDLARRLNADISAGVRALAAVERLCPDALVKSLPG